MGLGGFRRFGVLAAGCFMAAALMAAGPQARAAGQDNPCAYEPIDIDKYGGAEFQNPPVIRSENGVLRTTLNLVEHLAATHDVELISVIRRRERPAFRFPEGIRVSVVDDWRRAVQPVGWRRVLKRNVRRLPSTLVHPEDWAFSTSEGLVVQSCGLYFRTAPTSPVSATKTVISLSCSSRFAICRLPLCPSILGGRVA